MAQNQKQLFSNTVYQFLLLMDNELLKAQWHLHVSGNEVVFGLDSCLLFA